VPTTGIGQTLCRERTLQGKSLDDIARDTRIPRRHLEAIEAEDFTNLPGLVFTRNFVRQYAQALGIDADPILDKLPKLDESMIRLPDPPLTPRKRTRYSRSDAPYASLVWLAIALIAGVALFVNYNSDRINVWGKVRAGISLFRTASPTKVEAASKNVPPPQPQLPIEAHEVEAHESPKAPSAEDAKPASSVEVVVTALQEAWIQLSADGETSFTGVLRPHETKEISAVGQVKLVAGNAGGVSVSLNGKPLDPLGPVGQVRVVRLTAEGPEFLQTVHSPGPEPDPL
jgi:cytoskeletal protein RodZ